MAAKIRHLPGRGGSEGKGGSGAPCHDVLSVPAPAPTETLLGSVGGHSGTSLVPDHQIDAQ